MTTIATPERHDIDLPTHQSVDIDQPRTIRCGTKTWHLAHVGAGAVFGPARAASVRARALCRYHPNMSRMSLQRRGFPMSTQEDGSSQRRSGVRHEIARCNTTRTSRRYPEGTQVSLGPDAGWERGAGDTRTQEATCCLRAAGPIGANEPSVCVGPFIGARGAGGAEHGWLCGAVLAGATHVSQAETR